MGLERELHELLHEHDCVIVPGWGGFLAQYRPARIDEARALVHPPSKEVGFNRHLLRNDGLLTDHIAQREAIGFADANQRIDQAVSGWRAHLNAHGRVEIPRIGIFYHDAQRNLQFDPDDRANFLKESYGLRPIHATPVLRAAPEPQVIELPKLAVVEPAARVQGSEEPRRAWNWAAAATVALLLSAGAIGTYVGMNGGLDAFAFGLRPAPTYQAQKTPLAPLEARASVFALPEG
ncbi:MAG: hypothetical protein ACO1NQ_10535 [Flavobacteriales bacterium]